MSRRQNAGAGSEENGESSPNEGGRSPYVWVSDEEYAAIQKRMVQAGTQNFSAYIRKMALSGYVLNGDLTPVRDLISLQRRCANNLNQVAIHAYTYSVYLPEIAALQKIIPSYGTGFQRYSNSLR